MAKNEDGEFELILGNRQLLSVFFIFVVLLGLCFLMGYVVGRSTAPPVIAQNDTPAPAEHKDAPPPIVVTSPVPETKSNEPIKTAPQIPPPEETSKAEPPKAEPAKSVAPPPAPKAEAKAETKSETKAPQQTASMPPSGSQPTPGRLYLQLSATGKDEADLLVEKLRKGNFPSIAAQIPERPGLYRVLVGPLDDQGVGQMRNDLRAAGFAANDSIARKF